MRPKILQVGTATNDGQHWTIKGWSFDLAYCPDVAGIDMTESQFIAGYTPQELAQIARDNVTQ